MDTGSARKRYTPGEKAPISGIYQVLHHLHRKPHEVTLRAGETFPVCKSCANEVRFELRSLAGKEDGGTNSS
jgi:hypothetical protein